MVEKLHYLVRFRLLWRKEALKEEGFTVRGHVYVIHSISIGDK